ncbi:hypothetical protein KPL78_22955 [Roseomonas sp. HJA6]|uniref:DUF3168 domain-containing protein n=1 Tax=Roseomonas alba TaxID=2846776 RepID=A0ABS7AEK6_9PROT|nr:hypothetical protein [Neoroseomonas alba]MBW6400738.1 hypothetical protein [Neoroseomonas alba]
MRRKILALALLASLPLEAQADRAFCEGLQGLVQAAQSDFDWLPRMSHNIPGSLDERRGMVRSEDGPVRGAYIAVMFRHDANPAQLRERFAALQREVAGCLQDASALGTQQGGGGIVARWQTPYADISLRGVDGGGEIELSVARRW